MDVDLNQIRLSESKGRFTFKYRGEPHAFFLDIPRCMAKRGIFKSQFGKDTSPHMQVMLLLDMKVPEHAKFVEFVEKLTDNVAEEVSPKPVAKCLKSSTYEQDGIVMFCRLDTEDIGEGKVKILSKLEGFKGPSEYQSSFDMTGTVKIYGVCSSPNGMAFMKRIVKVVNEGTTEDECVVVDTSSDTLSFSSREITSMASMCSVAKKDDDDDDDDEKNNNNDLDSIDCISPGTLREMDRRLKRSSHGSKRESPDSDLDEGNLESKKPRMN